METILANVNGKVRRETLNGREYLVASATFLVQGVLNGSKGKLYYPSEQIGLNFDAWNGMPIVGNHPVRIVDGEEVHVSARDPEILAEQGLGYVFRTTVNGKLGGETWFDQILTENFDKKLPAEQQIIPRLLRGEPIEVSTGLYTTNEPAPAGATYNGVAYDYIAKDYRPDHLAVLPADKGACSVQDGCGVMVNKTAAEYGLPYWKRFLAAMGVKIKTLADVVDEKAGAGTEQVTNSEEVEPMNREQTISWLTTNCDCWKEKDGKETLNKLTDKQLAGLKATVETAGKYTLVLNKSKKSLTRNAEGDSEGEAAGVDIAALAEFLQITTDPAKDPVAFVEEIKTKLSEVLGKLGGKPAAPEPAEEPAVMEEGGAANEEEDEKEKAAAAVTNRRRGRLIPDRELTLKEWEDLRPRAADPIWNSMKDEWREVQTSLIQQIVSNSNYESDQDRAEHIAELRRLDRKSLKKQLARIGRRAAGHEEEPLTANYLGAGGAPVSSYRDDSQNLLPEFSVNRAELRKQKA